ncbi:hypothetical protein MAJ_11496, partial [Metarhizium majus ARSEF 297]
MDGDNWDDDAPLSPPCSSGSDGERGIYRLGDERIEDWGMCEPPKCCGVEDTSYPGGWDGRALRMEQHDKHRWCDRWLLGCLYSREPLSLDKVERKIREQFPNQKVEIFGIRSEAALGCEGEFNFVVRLAPEEEGTLCTESCRQESRVMKTEETEETEKWRVLEDIRYERLSCSVTMIVGDSRSIAGKLQGALGVDARPGGRLREHCFGDFTVRRYLVEKALGPLVQLLQVDTNWQATWEEEEEAEEEASRGRIGRIYEREQETVMDKE